MTTALVLLAALVATVSAVRGMWSPCGLSMLSSLNPVAERARDHGFALTAGWYVAGSTVGGALLGACCAAGAWAVGLAAPAAPVIWAVVIACALSALASDTRLVRWSLPEHPRQVDERWLTTYRRWIYAAGYGLQIGTGFATYIMTASVYLTAALAVLTGSPPAALLIGVGFGLVRGLTIVVAATGTSPERLRFVLARVDLLEPRSRQVALAAQAVVLFAAVAALAGLTGLAGLAGLAVLTAGAALRDRRPSLP